MVFSTMKHFKLYLIGPFGISNTVNLNCATYSPVIEQKCSTTYFKCHLVGNKDQKTKKDNRKTQEKMAENSRQGEIEIVLVGRGHVRRPQQVAYLVTGKQENLGIASVLISVFVVYCFQETLTLTRLSLFLNTAWDNYVCKLCNNVARKG